MGSEHSSQQGPTSSSGRANLQRGKSVPERESGPDNGEGMRPGSISPGPSICSDSDLPYISYTVNRPIGDSPKLPHKHGSQLQRGKSLGSSSRKSSGVIPKRHFSMMNKSSAHNIVVVKPAANAEATDKDPDLIRLQSVPMFLPIMRGTLNLPAVRDPEVLERLDPNGLLSLCLRYQQHIALCSELVASEQAQLGHKVRDIDFEITRIMGLMTERQKKCAKYAEKLGKVHELSHQLNRCHMVLNQTLESMETLNNTLPVEERLEPFVWTTG
ncbi:BLOC-1-related complex subunit 5 [Periplaneta americana]|uniref:BLOC-1-related complex subunit 5 n=1 Tax=Periplaneta americana TaxID=6978 RepID=UPI0037E7B035